MDEKFVNLSGDELVQLVSDQIGKSSLVSALPFMNFLNNGVQETQYPLKISMDESTIELALFERDQQSSSSFSLSTWNQPCTLDIFPIGRRATLTLDQSEKSLNRSAELDVDQINYNNGVLLEAAFTRANPVPYILSAERTGISLFQQDIDFGRSRMVEEFRIQGDQALDGVARTIWSPAIEDNFNAFRNLNRGRENSSFLVEQHPEVLELFDRMISGRFVEFDGAFKFAPEGAEGPIPMTSTSSTVPALFELGEFLRYRAQKG